MNEVNLDYCYALTSPLLFFLFAHLLYPYITFTLLAQAVTPDTSPGLIPKQDGYFYVLK